MRLARKTFRTLRKIEKRLRYLEHMIDTGKGGEKAQKQYELLAPFAIFYSEFNCLEEMVCAKYKGIYIPIKKYYSLITQDYAKGYKYAKDLFDNEYEYIMYALDNHNKDEDVDVIMLLPNMLVI